MLPFATVNLLWYVAPLAVSVSLVYSATRYEETASILRYAVRWMLSLSLALVAIFLFFYLIAGQL